MNIKLLSLFFSFFMFSTYSFALVTELGLQYSYQKKTFNASNYYQTESKGVSAALYFFDKFAYEMTYTDLFYESQEADTNSSRTVQQGTTVIDSSLIYILLDRSHFIQPYVKGGMAYIKKNQRVRYINASAIEVPESTGWGPSYGAGLKFILNERFSIKLSYDVWQTPLSDNSKSDDSALKAGLTWYL